MESCERPAAFAGAERQRTALTHLAARPPQTLLIEGGDEAARLDLGLYWAMALNCPNAGQDAPAAPCLKCSVCTQIMAGEYLDVLRYDGRISNREDEERPGPVRALKMENMRELKSILGTLPARARRRVAIFAGMSAVREEALNSLLKTLEEPSSHTFFVLLAPQRYQLLPTLVSRAICLTLPWRKSGEPGPRLAGLESELAAFIRTGRGFLGSIAGKGALDAELAGQLVISCQKALAQALGGNKAGGALAESFAALAGNAQTAFMVSHWLAEAQAMLDATASPARVAEALFTRIAVARDC